MIIYDDIINVGVSDKAVSVFEGQYKVNGMAYNSYLIKDEKAAVLDTVDFKYGKEWLENIKMASVNPDYLIITHMEPDHSSNIALFMREFPAAKIVANAKAFAMIKNFFGADFSDRKTEVKDGEELSLGKTQLQFIAAPMVHWPEVQMVYDKTDKILFSADAFGRFGTGEKSKDWAQEARRYYIGIVGKYGVQVQSVLKKAAALDIQAIYPLHGEVLTENLEYYINLYNTWSSYAPEEKGTAIIYTSVYGNTEKAVFALSDEILAITGKRPQIFNLSVCDMAEAVAAAFKYSNVVLATTTYNADIFPWMHDFIVRLKERNFQNRKIGFIENGSWAPTAAKVMAGLLESCKNLTFCANNVKILSAMTDTNINEIKALAKEITE